MTDFRLGLSDPRTVRVFVCHSCGAIERVAPVHISDSLYVAGSAADFCSSCNVARRWLDNDHSQDEDAYHYPSTAELFASTDGKFVVSDALRSSVEERYLRGRGPYGTDDLKDGWRVINSCMVNDSIELALEEVVDAVFNLLVANLKHANSDANPSVFRSLQHAILLWEELQDLRAS